MYRCVIRKPWSLAGACSAALCLALAVVVGCGPRPRTKDTVTEAERVKRTAGSVNAGEQAWSACFAEGAAPEAAERGRFLKYIYEMRDVSIDGDTATVKVEVVDQNGGQIGQTEWTLKKEESDLWKITTAPLPDGA